MTTPQPGPDSSEDEERAAARRRLVLVVVGGVLVVNLGAVALNIGTDERSTLGWIGLVLAVVSLGAIVLGGLVVLRARAQRR